MPREMRMVNRKPHRVTVFRGCVQPRCGSEQYSGQGYSVTAKLRGCLSCSVPSRFLMLVYYKTLQNVDLYHSCLRELLYFVHVVSSSFHAYALTWLYSLSDNHYSPTTCSLLRDLAKSDNSA